MLPFLDPAQLPALTVAAHPAIGTLRRAVEDLQAAHGWPLLSVNRTLTEALAPLPPERRGLAAEPALARALEATAGDPVILTDITLLFEPQLSLDPLRLLTRLAARRRLVVAWPGMVAGDSLAYAVPGHRHHRTWTHAPARLIAL